MRQNEHNLQSNCVRWFDLVFKKYAPLFFAVPNGGFRYRGTARKMKAEGVKAGVADMLLLVPNYYYSGLCIEFKTSIGRQSDAQKMFQSLVEQNGYKYIIIRDFDSFKSEVEKYLNTVYKKN